VQLREQRETPMSSRELYENYPPNNEYIRSYIEYQERYAHDARDSDKRLIELVGRLLAERTPTGRRPHLLDIGCSTGNLLAHLRKAYPTVELTGGDLSELSIAECKGNPMLAGATFEVWTSCDWATIQAGTTSSAQTPPPMASATICSMTTSKL
jgi:SAM-dependent methyltransferase